MTVRWGLLSTARINEALLAAARATTAAEVVAVASRSAERARAYAAQRGIPRAHGSYEALLADPEVDAVYVSLPNGLHAEWALRAARAGKHVLVEKPFAATAAEVERAFDAAEEAGVVMSEAFMWRHNPQTERIVALVREGAVGEVRLVRAWFSFDLGRPEDPRWDPALAGGALMDVGTYCVSAARLLCGEPDEVAAVAVGAGVDARLAGVLRFAGGALATFDCGFDLPHRHALEVVGAEGAIVADDPWHCRAPGLVVRRGKHVRHVAVAREDSYRLELEDVSAAVATGRPPLLGRADAVGQARALERLRAAAAPLGR